MNLQKLRAIVPVVVIVLIAIGFGLLNNGVGTLSAVGWGDVALLCPLGALETMLASKLLIPRAVISLVLVIAAILLFGRAFCSWICPVPLVSRLRDAFSKKKKPEAAPAPVSDGEITLSSEELSALKGCQSCGSCAANREKFDSRHFILGGTLLSAAIFGFPVFCLICPIGLTFATVLLVMLLFGNGDVTWSVILIPTLLLIEVVFFRKWCTKICPLSAFMSLIAKGNKTFVPTIDHTKCLESTRGVTCGKCHQVCHVKINPRHPEMGAAWNECSKCHACVDNCPGGAISMPVLPKKKQFGQTIMLENTVDKSE